MQGAVWRCWFGSLAHRGRCSLPGVPITGKENRGKNMKFILVAKTMQAFPFFVNEQHSFSVCLGTLPCKPK